MITEVEYEEYTGLTPPTPFNKWLDLTTSSLLAEFNRCWDNIPEEIKKKALILQMEFLEINRDTINGSESNFSIGKFSVGRGTGGSNMGTMTISTDVRNLLDPYCSRWVIPKIVGGCG